MRRRMRAETEHTKANYWTKWAHTLVKAASISKKIDSSVFSKVHRKSFFRKHSDQSSQMTGHAQGSQIKSTRIKKGKAQKSNEWIQQGTFGIQINTRTGPLTPQKIYSRFAEKMAYGSTRPTFFSEIVGKIKAIV